MAYFICPRCARRSQHSSRTQGTGYQRPRGCERCGFGFLFELLEDYMPARDVAMFVTDVQTRVIGVGEHQYQLTGRTEEELVGQPVRDVLGLRFESPPGPDGTAPDAIATTLEWGVRSMGKPVSIVQRDGDRIHLTGDFFPAYDEDGGLLVSLWGDDASGSH